MAAAHVESILGRQSQQNIDQVARGQPIHLVGTEIRGFQQQAIAPFLKIKGHPLHRPLAFF